MVGFLTAIVATAILDAYFTYINKHIVDQGIVPGKFNVVVNICRGLWRHPTWCQSALCSNFVYLAGVLGERIQYDLRKMMFNHLQELSLSYYSQNAVGRLIARVTSDSGRVAELMTWGVVDMTWAILNITHLTDLHADHQLEAGTDRVRHHPDHGPHRRQVPQEDPGGIPQIPAGQLEDHRRIQ